MKVGELALMHHGSPATWETRQGLGITFVGGLVGLTRSLAGTLSAVSVLPGS